MRIAIFSDVHGNATALRAVLEAIDQEEALDEVVFAGDLCLFGPDPKSCVDMIRRRDAEISCVYGNTDKWIDGPPLLSDDIDAERRKRLQHIGDISWWTSSQLAADERAWLRELPFQRRISPTVNPHDDLLLVHANPKDVDQIIFPSPQTQKKLYGNVRQSDVELRSLLGQIVVGALAFGHLHVPFVREWEGIPLFNISSVSLPGDGDPRAKYAVLVWDGHHWSVQRRFVDFDVEAEIAAFHRAKPPGWEEAVEELEASGMIEQHV